MKVIAYRPRYSNGAELILLGETPEQKQEALKKIFFYMVENRYFTDFYSDHDYEKDIKENQEDLEYIKAMRSQGFGPFLDKIHPELYTEECCSNWVNFYKEHLENARVNRLALSGDIGAINVVMHSINQQDFHGHWYEMEIQDPFDYIIERNNDD